MCLGIPGEVVAITDEAQHLATVAVNGVRRTISLALLPDGSVTVGDWVLVHVGFAMTRIDADEAAATLAQIQQLGQLYTDELAAYTQSAAQ